MSALVTQFLDKSGNSVDQYQNFLHSSQPGVRPFRYLTLQVETKDIESIGLYEDYHWKISLWNTKSSRISRDLFLKSDNFNDVHVFELPALNEKDQSSHTYIYIDLVHRLSGVPIASGSQVIALPGSKDSNGDAYTVHKVSAQLPLCEHIKYWPTHERLEYTHSNGTRCVVLNASIGTLTTFGRIDSVTNSSSIGSATQLIPFTTVASFQPSLLDRLRATAVPLLHTYTPPCVWYLTVEDLQLTSDILDLYVDRHILVSAGCGGAASLAPHSYLGNILRYEGHYIERAEIAISAVQDDISQHSYGYHHGDVYKSCMNFEVKVVECASGRDTLSAGDEAPIDRCVLCVGVLQLAQKVPHNDPLASDPAADGSILDPEELTSGTYEVLLYTVYNPDAEIEVTLVGKAVVKLHVPDSALSTVSPVASADASASFQLLRFEDPSRTSAESFLYWAQCLVSCCASLQHLGREPESSVREGRSAERHKEALRTELKALLQVLGRPQYAESVVHAEIIRYLVHCGAGVFNSVVQPALHAYFQEWLLSEELSALMLPSTIPDRPSENVSPVKMAFGPASSQPSPVPGMMGAESPGKSRPKSPYSSTKFSIASPLDSMRDVDWESVRGSCACIKLLGQHALFSASQTSDDHSASLSSLGAAQQDSEPMDHASLCEMSEDLLRAMLTYATQLLRVWVDWSAQCPVGSIGKDAWKHLGPDCLRRLRKAFSAMCLLISNVTTVEEGTQLAFQTFTATLLDFARVISRLPGQHDLGLKDWYESWMEATFRELCAVLLINLQIVKVYTYPQNNPTAALPACLNALCACADVLSGNSAWQQQALNCNLHVALTEVIVVMSQRMCERITNFAEERDEEDAPMLGLPISLWSLRDTTEKKEIPVEPTVDPPLSTRKLNRRSSAVNMFGADVTVEPGTLSQPQVQAQTQPQGTLPSVAFSPSVTAGPINGTVVDEETRTRNLLAADTYSEEAVLHFLHENKSYACALRGALSVLLQVQPKSKLVGKGKTAEAPAGRQTSVGVLSGFLALHELCDRLMNGLCKGMVTKPEVLKALIRSSADINGLSGQGMLIFVELMGWLHGALFNFVRDNQALQIKMDVATAQALADRAELLVLYHLVFCDILWDNARADRYLNRTVWLAHQGGTDLSTASTLFTPPTPSSAGTGILNFSIPDAPAPPPPMSPQFRGAPSPSVSSAVLGIASNRAKRFEEFSAAGSLAVARWIAVRRTLQESLYAACECTVAIARAADLAGADGDGDKEQVARLLCISFGKCVALFCRNVLMLDLGLDSRDIVTALVAETPLHIPMQQLYRLAESVPASLLPERATASPEYNAENSLTLLISTIFDVVKLHTDLKADPYPAALDPATCALAQLLEDITLKSIQTTKDGTMFYLKNILKTPLNSYLLVDEDPAWSAQPIIMMKAVGDGKQTKKNDPPPASPFRSMMIDFLRSFNADWKLQPSLAFLQREFSLHMTSSKLLICARHALSNEDPLLRHSPAQYPLLRSMFEKTLLGSALTNTLLFGLRFMRSSEGGAVDACLPLADTNDNLLFMVGQLAEIFRSKPDASTAKAGQNSSELLSVFGCSFKAYHDLLHLIIHRQQYSGELTGPIGSAVTPALTTSEVSRRLEQEIYQLRHCLQGLLRSGQWEVGVEVAQLYLEKYKTVSALPFVPPPPPPPPLPVATPGRAPATPSRASPLNLPPMSPTKSLISIGSSKNQVSTPQRAPFSPVAQQQSFTFEDPRGNSSAASSPVPAANPAASIAKRIDAIKAELVRVLDTLDSRIKSNGDLRLFPHFYALRFVSDTPWEASTQDETIERALGHIREEGYQCTSAWMHLSAAAGDGQPAPTGQLRRSSVYEYWLLMKFDASSFPVCADFYDDILALDEQRVQDAQRGVQGGDRSGSGFSMVSPIAYHNIQAQLAMAYPAYTMVSSHHMMESYFSENTFDTQRAGYVKFMQLFQTFPADICDEAQQPAVLDALQAIQEAKTAKLTVTAEQAAVCDDIDGLDLTRGSTGPDGEAKAAESVAHSQGVDAEDSDFVTQLKKHLFTDTTPTRFFAYSFMTNDQIDAMDEEYKARGDDLPEDSAYIQRFELAVSDSSVNFTHLRTPLDSELPPVRPINSTLLAPAPVGVRNRYSRPGTDVGSVDGGAGAAGPGAGNATTAAGVSDLKALGVFDVSPVNLAVHRASTRCTPIDVSLETMYYVSVQLRRALEALKKLNEFSKTELANEPVGDVISSDSIFAGVFTLLSNLLSMPNCNCLGFNNLETILVSEQERIDVEWQEERKGKKQAYNKALEEYEESKQLESKKWKKYMKERPVEPDFPALEAAFYAQPRHAHLRSVQTLHDEAQLLLWKTIKEMRKFVAAKEDKVPGTVHALSTEELRNIAIKKGRRPTVTSMVLRSNLAVHLAQMPDTMDAQGGPPVEPADTEKSLKMKLCLFVESLFAAMEVGIPI